MRASSLEDDVDAERRLEATIEGASARASAWRRRALAPEQRWSVAAPDVGVACEVILADRLFRDLSPVEERGLMARIRGAQDPSGAWLGREGAPDLSLTALGWWACVQVGDDPHEERLERALRVVHALGGAQRASFSVRLWLAIGGHIPWSWLPAVPAELWLLPASSPFSPSQVSTWARGILTPYLLLTRAPARVHLASAAPLLLTRGGAPISPRITRDGLIGDLVQNLDAAIKALRKVPRGPLLRASLGRAQAWLAAAQQAHGGWFSARPTILSLLALRVAGAPFHDPRIRRGLDYLRGARGLVVGGEAPQLAQGLQGAPLAVIARLIQAAPQDEDALPWLLAQEISEPGEWQRRANAPAGGWPVEAGAREILDVEATCAALDAIAALPKTASQSAAAWAATRRAIEVLLAMQEPDGAFARFERGESSVWLTTAPWRDAELLAYGHVDDEARVRRTATVLRQLARVGLRAEDDRVRRGLTWLEGQIDARLGRCATETLAALAQAAALLYPEGAPRREAIERQLRARQREDGSFGAAVTTAAALIGLCAVQERPCVQARRAARALVALVESGAVDREAATISGHGFTLTAEDPSAGAREAALALRAYAARGGQL
jgi:squalene-hopene/tetraprenyl-beta-curcumene cyclase